MASFIFFWVLRSLLNLVTHTLSQLLFHIKFFKAQYSVLLVFIFVFYPMACFSDVLNFLLISTLKMFKFISATFSSFADPMFIIINAFNIITEWIFSSLLKINYDNTKTILVGFLSCGWPMQSLYAFLKPVWLCN